MMKKFVAICDRCDGLVFREGERLVCSDCGAGRCLPRVDMNPPSPVFVPTYPVPTYPVPWPSPRPWRVTWGPNTRATWG